MVESTEAEDGVMCAIADTGMRCRVLGVSTEAAIQSSPSLILGELEELEEADEEDDESEQECVSDEDRTEDGAEILLDADRLEDLRERQLLLEVLHATMENWIFGALEGSQVVLVEHGRHFVVMEFL